MLVCQALISHIDVTENIPKTHGAYVLGGERGERYISKIIYKLINALRNNKEKKMLSSKGDCLLGRMNREGFTNEISEHRDGSEWE